MKYTNLGRTGLSVSRLGLGTLNFGPFTPEDESRRLLDAALASGINLIDTSNSYGRHLGRGTSEAIIGRWLAENPHQRDRIVLGTKLYRAAVDWPNDGRLSAKSIRTACEASLKRLNTDYIDIYQMHHVDRSTPWDEIWEAMHVLKQAGKILYVGSSNFAAWDIVKASYTAKSIPTGALVSEQSIYNIAQRAIELEVIPAAIDQGVGIIPYSPLHSGLLTGRLPGEDQVRSLEGRAAKARAAVPDRIVAYRNLCAEWKFDPAQVAIAWLLQRPGVTAPLLGPRTVEQFELSLPAIDLTLSAEFIAALEVIFPGPGEAPAAYSW